MTEPKPQRERVVPRRPTLHDLPHRERPGARMSVNLQRRSFLKELDFSPQEWRFLLGSRQN